MRIVGDLARGGLRMQLKAWPFPFLALVLGLAGLLLGLGISFLVPAHYVSEAVLRIDSGHLTTDRVDMLRAEQEVESRTNLARIIAAEGLYGSDLKVEPLEDVILEMRRDIQVDPLHLPGRGSAFRIRFDYGDRIKAQQTLSALVSALVGQTLRWHAGPFPTKLTVIHVPNLPTEPVSPTRPMMWGGGFLMGVLIAALLRRIFRKSWIRRRFVWVAVAMGIAGIVVASHGTDLYLWPGTYRSTTTFVLRTAQPGGAAAATAELLSPEGLSAIANDPRLRLYQREMDKEPITDVLRRMRERISISEHPFGDGDGTEITLAFEYNDPYKARQTLNSFVGSFEDFAARRLAPPPDSAISARTIEVLDQPSMPEAPAKPNRALLAVMGGACGVFLAGIISLVRRQWKPAIPA